MASSNFASSSVKYTYPYPIEVNVRDFVPIICSKRNYPAWRSLMLRLIESRGLSGFINGEVVVPPKMMTVPNDKDDANSSINSTKEMENPNYKAWKRTDEMLQRWIIGTIHEDTLMDVVDLQTAKDMWTSIEKFFHPTKTVYPYPIEVNVKDYVPIMLSREKENYSLWKKLMLRLINGQGLADFINDEVKAPSKRDPDYKAWRRTDMLLQSWIIGTTNEDLLATSADLYTAIDIWKKLEKKLVFLDDKLYDDTDMVEETLWEEQSQSSEYGKLVDATRCSDWERVKEYLKRKPEAVRDGITPDKATVLMVAVSSSMLVQRHEVNKLFVKNPIQLMSPDDVAVRDVDGRTALHYAAADGNIHATKLLVEKNSNLANLYEYANGDLPIEVAAQFDRGNVAAYLFDCTSEDIQPLQPESILLSLSLQGLYDDALRFVKKYPALTFLQDTEPPVLQSIAMDRHAFRSGTNLNWCQSLIYSCAPMRLEVEDTAYCCSERDIEIAANYFFISGANTMMKKKLYGGFWKLYDVFWKVAEMLVPQIKDIQELKCKHHQAQVLVEHICVELKKLEYSKAQDIIKKSLLAATSSGIHEIIEQILSKFPRAIHLKNEETQNIFHIALLNRRPKVFKLICSHFLEFSVRKFLLRGDLSGNTYLDMVARFESTQKLKLKDEAAGPALQMQQELQWFEGVKKLTLDYKGKWEVGRKTPAMVFSETHRGLVKEGEKWMKDTANSCTIEAALIATVVFAAAITVPGGTNDKSGLPILSNEKAFNIFFISDALALFSSASSVFIFLSILTSRYAESDFLYSLPKRLIGGLITLFISIIAMMIAFGATLYLFGQKKAWILIPVTAFSCAPVTLFAFSQFPLLLDMIKSTYSPVIFGKRSHKISYG